MNVGTRVKLKHDVDRYPHFIAGAGSTGTVTHSDGRTLCVRMDEAVSGAETWDNEVVWSIENGDDPTRDVDVLDGPEPCQAIEDRRKLTEGILRATSPAGTLDRRADGSEEAMLNAFSVLRGIVNEYQAGGDQLTELCTCGEHAEGFVAVTDDEKAALAVRLTELGVPVPEALEGGE